MTAYGEPFTLFLDWLGRSSLQAGVLVGMILATQALLRDKLSPRWRSGLWLLLILRLALPWAPQSSLSLYNFVPQVPMAPADIKSSPPVFPGEESGPQVQHEGAITAITHEATPRVSLQSNELSRLIQDPRVKATSAVAEPPAASGVADNLSSISPVNCFPWIWLAGMGTLLAIVLVQSFAFATAVLRRRPITDKGTLDLLEDCKERMGVRSWLMIVETPRVKTPALFGFIRPRLLLPEGAVESLGPERLRHVFLHKLAHLKRGDIAMNWLITLLQIMHWFNPLIWYGFHRMRGDRELACDDLALAHVEEKETGEYGRTIIHLLEKMSQPRRLPGLAGILEDKNSIRRRIAMIATFKRDPRRWSALTAILILGLGFVTLTNAQDKEQTTDEEQVIETKVQGTSPTRGLRPSPAVKEKTKTRRVLIPDADTQGTGVILDLASGELLPARDGDEQLTHLRLIGKGDIAFDRVFVCARGTRAFKFIGNRLLSIKSKEQVEDMTVYDLKSFTSPFMVKTAEGTLFEIKVLKVTDDGGLEIEYRVADLSSQDIISVHEIKDPDKQGVDLDVGQVVNFLESEVRPDTCELKWNPAGGGSIVAMPGSQIRVLPWPSKNELADVLYVSLSDPKLLQKSKTRTFLADDTRFFSVLTSEGQLAVVEIGGTGSEVWLFSYLTDAFESVVPKH